MICQIIIKTIKKKNLKIINILKNYLKSKEQDKDKFTNINNDLEKFNKENNSFILNNSNKKTKFKEYFKDIKKIKIYYKKKQV